MRGRFAILPILFLSAAVATAAEPTILPVQREGELVSFRAAGLPPATLSALRALAPGDARWSQAFSVYVADESAGGDLPAMLGAYTVQGDELQFTPKYALRPGMRYRVVLRTSAKPIVHEITIPEAPRGEPTKVVIVYPSADALPENLLKFYLHFSAPMSRGEAYEHIQLVKENGEVVDMPFLEIGEEFWSKDGRRLMLLIDPGRIKRGVKPREDLGPALSAGNKYSLVISRAWHDAQGQPLAANFTKHFTATKPVEVAIDPTEWTIAPPAPGSRKPLRVRFPRPLDHALLESTLSVVGPGDETLTGEIAITDRQCRWEFRPERPWSAGSHQLVVDTILEDLSGNRIGLAFEIDRLDPIQQRVESKFVRLPFRVGANR